jgi:hypothetical protein
MGEVVELDGAIVVAAPNVPREAVGEKGVSHNRDGKYPFVGVVAALVALGLVKLKYGCGPCARRLRGPVNSKLGWT